MHKNAKIAKIAQRWGLPPEPLVFGVHKDLQWPPEAGALSPDPRALQALSPDPQRELLAIPLK